MSHRSAAEWERILTEQLSSGVNVATFCRQNGINAKTFSNQKQKRSHRSERNDFVQVAISSNEAIIKPSLILSHGSHRLEFNELPPTNWLIKLLKAGA